MKSMTNGNPASTVYFPNRCVLSCVFLGPLRARASAPSADPSSKHARSTLGRLCRCRSRKFKLHVLHKQQTTTVELELELELGAERGRRATSVWRFISRYCFYVFAFVHMSAVISLR